MWGGEDLISPRFCRYDQVLLHDRVTEYMEKSFNFMDYFGFDIFGLAV